MSLKAGLQCTAVKIRGIATVVALTLGLSATVTWLHRPRDVPIDTSAPLTSVLRHNGYVFACSEKGLYRADLATHSWTQLRLSPFVPRGGRFIAARNRPEIYYLAAARPILGTKAGLWRSRDNGSSWKCVLDAGRINSAYISPGGIIYAHSFVSTPERVKLLMSQDSGDDWEDITHGIGWVSAICADPSNPELIAGERYGGRRYLVRASDLRYRWQQPGEFFPISFTSDLIRDSSFRSCATQTVMHMANATLANYFDEPFGDSPQVCAFDIVPRRPNYHASSDGHIPVEIELRCYSTGVSAVLTDADDLRQFWSITVLAPSGKTLTMPERKAFRRQQYPATAPVRVPESDDIPDVGDRTTAGFHTFTLDKSHPYRRMLELSQFGAFSSPGRYRVRVRYGNMGSSPIVAGEWRGMFEGETFTLTIENGRPK